MDEPVSKRQRTNMQPEFEQPKLALRAMELQELMRSSKGFLGTVFNQTFFKDGSDECEDEDTLQESFSTYLRLHVLRKIMTKPRDNEESKGWCCFATGDDELLFEDFTVVAPQQPPLEIQCSKDFQLAAEIIYNRYSEKSMFGDMQKLETVFDETVRKSRELPYLPGPVDLDTDVRGWTFGTKFLADLAVEWRSRMDYFPVKIMPHKLVLYGEGEFFKPHRDTPSPDLVGSIVVGLMDTSQEGGLVLDQDVSSKYSSSAGQCWFFRPDILHEVEPVKHGMRCVLTFKVYALKQADQAAGPFRNSCPLETLENSPDSAASPASPASLHSHDLCLAIASTLQELFDQESSYPTSHGLGLLLWHQYSRTSTALQGNDYLLWCASHHMTNVLSVRNIPVRIDFSSSQAQEEKAEIHECDVYSLEDHVLQQIDAKADSIDGLGGPYTFYQLSKRRPDWSFKESSDQGGFTGNEAEPSTEDCIYLHRALVFDILKK